MTNYRFEGCKEHDAPQFVRCFDCGCVMDRQEISTIEYDDILFVADGVHCKFWFYPHCQYLHIDEEGFAEAKDYEKCEHGTKQECWETTSCDHRLKVIR